VREGAHGVRGQEEEHGVRERVRGLRIAIEELAEPRTLEGLRLRVGEPDRTELRPHDLAVRVGRRVGGEADRDRLSLSRDRDLRDLDRAAAVPPEAQHLAGRLAHRVVPDGDGAIGASLDGERDRGRYAIAAIE